MSSLQGNTADNPNRYSIRPFAVDKPAERSAVRTLFARTPSVGYPSWYTADLLAQRQQEAADLLFSRLTKSALTDVGEENAPVPEAVFVAEMSSTIVGFTWVSTRTDPVSQQRIAHLEDLATAPGYEGHGIGHALVVAAEEWARACRYEAITLNVWPKNTRAQLLYRRLGYTDEMLRMKKTLAEARASHSKAQLIPKVVRVWRGCTRREDADAYLAFLKARAIPDYRRVSGNRGVQLLRRLEGDVAHFECVTWWESEAAIRGFAGDDITRAKYYPEDSNFLLDFPERVKHYEVFSDSETTAEPAIEADGH